MHGGHRPVVAGVHRLHELHGLSAAYLAQHQSIRAHSQRGAQQLRQRDLSAALSIGRAGLESDDMQVIEA